MLHINGKKIKTVYYGSRKIKEAWYGGKKVYTSTKVLKVTLQFPLFQKSYWEYASMVGDKSLAPTFTSDNATITFNQNTTCNRDVFKYANSSLRVDAGGVIPANTPVGSNSAGEYIFTTT